jgi:predicted transglutaminase-like cysteine proteinase
VKAIAIVCSFVCLAAATSGVRAQPADQPLSASEAAALDTMLAGLFAAPDPQTPPDVLGYAAVPVGATAMDAQWRAATISGSSGIAGPWADLVARVRSLPAPTRAAAVNVFVNHSIAFSDDASIYGVSDHWAGLEETVRRGRGDCEDFALAKMQLLAAAGAPQRDLYLVIVRDMVRDIDHAVLAVRDGDRFYILDSANDRVSAPGLAARYRPIASFSGDARWTFGHRAADMASAVIQPAAE